MKKFLPYTLAVLLICIGIWGYKLIWGKPLHFDHFAERFMISTVITEPEILSTLGMVDNTILDFHSHKLTDASPGHSYRWLDRNRRYHKLLQRYNRERLSGQKNITYDMLEWILETELERETLLAEAKSAVDNEVTNGFRYLIDTFEELRPRAGEHAGVWALPNGENYYHYLTRMHTTLSLNPEEIHETGLIVVEYIRDLRTLAENSLGEQFDVAEFHDVVLMNGAMPLDVLTVVVQNWIDEKG